MSESAKPEGDKSYTIKDIERERAHADHFKQQLDDLTTRFKDLDPEQYKKDKEELKEFRRKSAGGDEVKIQELVDREKAEIEKRYSDKIKELEDRVQNTTSDLKREKVTKTILAGLAGKVRPDSIKLLEPVIERDCDLHENKLVIRGEDGKPRYSKSNPSNLMTHEEYILELEGSFPSCFEATSKAGGRNGVERVNGHSNTGQFRTLEDFKRMPDGGKAAMLKMGRENPSALAAILQGQEIPAK